jgi:hypothetical protein
MPIANQKLHGYTEEEYVSYGSDVLTTNSLNRDATICQEKGTVFPGKRVMASDKVCCHK